MKTNKTKTMFCIMIIIILILSSMAMTADAPADGGDSNDNSGSEGTSDEQKIYNESSYLKCISRNNFLDINHYVDFFNYRYFFFIGSA